MKLATQQSKQEHTCCEPTLTVVAVFGRIVRDISQKHAVARSLCKKRSLDRKREVVYDGAKEQHHQSAAGPSLNNTEGQ